MKRLLVLVSLCLAFLVPSPPKAQVETAIAASTTLGALFSGLNDVVNEIEEGASNLLAQGNMAAAQQQMLLAGILEQTIKQLEVAYSNSIDKTFSSFSVAEQNTFTALQAQVSQIDGLLDGSASDVQEIIYQSQGAANQLLDRIPLTSSFPVFYGMTVGDLTPEMGASPRDIEILGFYLSDPALNSKPPIITVDGEAIPENAVSVQQDRIHVQVPDHLKERLGIENSPCNPRKTFPITITTFYVKKRGWGILGWNEEKTVSFNANALVAPEAYDVEISYSGTRSSTVWDAGSHETSPQYKSMGCEDNTSASARYAVPEGSRRLQCSAKWISMSNVKNQNATCAVSSNVATATGNMRGRDREWTGNCPGGGHGSFVMSVSWEAPRTATEPYSSISQRFIATKPVELSASLGVDASVSGITVDVSIHRAQCETEFDHIQIPTVASEMRYDQSSKNGRFGAVLQNGHIAVSENN
ncbi:hypothetical protein [Sulfitobacter pacificus]|uniref:hypothetical protein n=1 Tax=Sulfitobacter pacificus TaxID=1499314 RepID=UPI00310BF21E